MGPLIALVICSSYMSHSSCSLLYSRARRESPIHCCCVLPCRWLVKHGVRLVYYPELTKLCHKLRHKFSTWVNMICFGRFMGQNIHLSIVNCLFFFCTTTRRSASHTGIQCCVSNLTAHTFITPIGSLGSAT